YNFTLYTEWPSSAFPKADSPIIIAVVGEDPIGPELEAAVNGKTVRGRPIEVRRYARLSDVEPCHILYLPSSEAKHLPQILKKLPHASLLTVGENEDFTQSGGVIRFFVDENKIRFEVNTDAAHRAKLKLSSKLLALARIVRDSEGTKDR